MITLITYDITSPERLRKMHRFLKDFGLNTQKSVFECSIDREGLKIIRAYAGEGLDLSSDAFRIYKICAHCMKKVMISGQGLKVTQMDYTII